MSSPRPGIVESVGPYRLLRAIGAGGSARIDLARIDRAYGFVRHVVVKRPLEHLRGDASVAASLRREARIGGRLRHPNLVAVLDAGSHEGYDYLVLEYIHGTSLRDLMQTPVAGQVREVPLAVALGLVIDIARGLHQAHQLAGEHGEPLGLVHRDVSPGNVLIGLDGAVKVADFGIAKETRVTTLSGSMNGTVTYMAPEQCQGHAIDRRADEWALGVILHELVTKQRLFLADNDVASLHRVLSGQITRPRRLDSTIAPQLEEIIMTALSQAPDGRFATTQELASALEGFAANQGLVIGARSVAKAIEQAVGARAAPWIKPAAPSVRAAEQDASLVTVIENEIEVDLESLLPTFGPTDEPDAVAHPDEHVIEEAPGAVLTTTPKRRIAWMIGVATTMIGIGIGTAIAVRSREQPVLPPPRPTTPAATMPIASPETGLATGLATEPTIGVSAGSASPAPEEGEVETPVPAQKAAHHHHGPHVTIPVAAGSNAAVIAAPPPMTVTNAGSGAGSSNGAPPHPVEWKPSMLLPTDSSSDKPKKP